jgi:hypothetical protein
MFFHDAYCSEFAMLTVNGDDDAFFHASRDGDGAKQSTTCEAGISSRSQSM